MNEFKKGVMDGLLRKVSTLSTYMNAYSMTIRDVMNEDDFNVLYDALCLIDKKYSNHE